jgi:hypothetical protein
MRVDTAVSEHEREPATCLPQLRRGSWGADLARQPIQVFNVRCVQRQRRLFKGQCRETALYSDLLTNAAATPSDLEGSQ